MATMYVGGGLYLPTTGTASKPKTTSTPTGGTVTVAQRNAIASKTKPAATTVAKKPTTNTLSSMAGSSLGTTSTKKPTTVASPASTSSMGTSRSVARPRNTDAQNAAVASLLSGAGTGGINAVRRSANPVNVVGYRPPPVGSSTHGMIVNSPGNYPPTSFQSLQNAASSLAAIQAAQRERDARAAKTPQLFGGGYAPFVQPERVGTPPPPGVYPGSVAYNDWQSRLLQSGGVPQHFATPVTVPPMATKDEYAAGGKYADRNWYADTLGYGATQFRHGFGDLLGTPISALNSAATGVQMLAGNPNPDRSLFFGGGEDFKRILDFGGVIPAVPARDRTQEDLGLLAYLAGGGFFPASVPGKAGAVLTPARVSAPRVAAPIVAAPRAAAGIDAALTPRQVAFRELMDNLNANPANAGPRAGTEGLTLVHGSTNPALTLDDIQIIRTGGQKQGKPGRVYGGLYTHAEDDVNLAANYAKMGDGTPSLYNVQIKPGAKVEDFGVEDVTRLKKERIDELIEQGVGVVKGQNPLGKTEWVVIDKNAIQDFAPRASAGINAAIPPTPRQVALRDLTPEQEYVRDFVETRGRLPPPNDDFFNPTSVRMFDDDKSVLSDPLSDGSLAREQALSTPLEGTYPYPRVGASGGYDDMLYSSVEDALGVGPTLARAEQFTPPAATGGSPATEGNAFSRVLDEIEAAERAALAARSGQLFPDINPAATVSDPMEVFGPQRPAQYDPYASGYNAVADALKSPMPFVPDSPNFVSSYPDMLDLVGPRRPDFMFPDEAADIIRPGPRVAADADKRMDPFTKKALITAAGGIATLPVIGGLSLLANGQLGPAPTATTPQPVAVPDGQRGIDAIDPRAAYAGAQSSMRDAMSARRLAEADAVWSTLRPAPAAPGVKFGDVKVLNGEPVKRDALGRIVPVVAPDERLVTEDVALPGSPEAVIPIPAWSLSPPVHIPGGVGNATTYVREIDNFPIDSDVPITAEKQAKGGGRGAPASGEQGEDTASAAGKKFTPGPGQFVGTNGYIYEQSSDGSFEKVGKVPGYTPAQLSEAANKGAFRDPNNIVTGGAKPRKQARKKGERTFFDDAGDFLKDRFDDSVYGKLSKLFFPDDAAAAEAAATGPEAVEYYSTPPSSVPESLVSSSGSSKKRKKKDEDETDEGTGGTGSTGTSPYTPEVQAMLNALYGNYMRQYNGPGVGYVPGVDPERNYFTPAFADGGLVDGRLVLGDGGPKEDKIPAMIDGVEQAKLSNGEFVMTAAAVKNAGGGDIELGAKRLMDLNNMLSYGRPAERLKVQHVK